MDRFNIASNSVSYLLSWLHSLAALTGCDTVASVPEQRQASPLPTRAAVIAESVAESPLTSPRGTTPPRVIRYPDRVVVNLATIGPDDIGRLTISVTMSLSQHLVVIPDYKPGLESLYEIHYDSHYSLTALGPIVAISPNYSPAPTMGWEWSAHSVGETGIIIGAVECFGKPVHCSPPGPFVFIDVQVVS